MATKRKYAYYIKGNNIAIVEENIGSGVCSLSGYSNQTTCEAAGGTWTENAFSSEDSQYKSPVATIEDGLEIQYSYNPDWSLAGNLDQGGLVRLFKPLAWFANTGYLSFGLPDFDWSDNFSGSTGFQVGEKILIRGSSRWNGIHTIKSIHAGDSDGTTEKLGILETNTRYSSSNSIHVPCNFDNTAKTIVGNTTQAKNEIARLFPSSGVDYYVWIDQAASASNNANLYKVASNGEGTLTASAQYTVTNAVPTESTTPVFSDATGDTVTLFRVTYEPVDLYHKDSFIALEDETFELDLSRYQANAVVYYLKAKMFEDAGDFEKRELFLREFKKQLEKGAGALKRGPYIAQGFSKLR